MKKLLSLSLALFLVTFFVKAQTPIFTENFDNGLPSGWTQIDANNDGYMWEGSDNPVSYFAAGTDLSGSGHNGSNGFVLSGSYSNVTSNAITPDNWLITPVVQLTGAATLSFWTCSQDEGYSEEHYGVYISTTTNTDTAAFTLLQEYTIGQTRTQTAWENHTINLSAYNGQMVYIAFRHFNCNDQFLLDLDDVEITVFTSNPLIVANPTTIDMLAAVNGMAMASVHVDGYNLISPITATATAPFEISSNGTNFSSTASLSQTGGTLYVRYSPTVVGSDNSTITLSSTGATNASITINGSALEAVGLCDFENASEDALWTIVNGSNPNGWYIGTATNATSGGSRALYVSNDNGTSNSYTANSASTVWAYRDFNFGTHSEYTLSFKFRCAGESTWDYLRVYIGTPNTASLPTDVATPQGAEQIGDTYYNLQPSWTNESITIPAAHSGTQRIYFLWRNDTSVGNDPAAAIDDIIVFASDCGSTSVPTVTNITAFTADIAWQAAVVTDDAFIVQYKPSNSSWNDADVVTLNVTGTTWQLTNLMPSTTYQLRVATDCGSEHSEWRTTSFTTTATCYAPTNVSISQITGTSAIVSWTEAAYGANNYTVAYSEAGQDNWTPWTVDGTSYMLSGLNPNTAYDVMVSSNCDLGTATPVELNFTTKCLAGGDIAIGEGSNTSGYIPSYSLYEYSYTQQLFTTDEMGGATTLHSVSFHIGTVSDPQRVLMVYLMHTNASNIGTGLDVSNAQLVYSDTLHIVSGWNTLTFSNPFAYNGMDNLVLVVIDMTGSWSSTNSWTVHTAFSGASCYTYQDGTSYNISSLPSCSSSNKRNDVIFGSPCDSTTTCVAPNIFVTEVGVESITVDWAPGYQETDWELEYATDTNWTSVGSVTAPYELTGLDANTTYYLRIRSVCGPNEYSDWAGTSARTKGCDTTDQCEYIFIAMDSYGDGWNDAYIEVVQNGGSVASVTAEHHGGGNTQSIDTIVVPLCGDYTTQLVWHSGSYDNEISFSLIGADGAEITSINDLTAYSTNDVITTFSTNCSGCRVPGNVAYTLSSDGTTATITWTAGSDESNWILEYQEGNGSWDTVTIAGTPTYTLNNLTAATLYTIHVKSDCGYGISGFRTITFSTPLCDAADQCEYTLNLTDAADDGWNGAFLTVTQNGIVVASNITVPDDQSQNTVTLGLCNDMPVQLIWHSGGWDSECDYTLLDPNGTLIATHSGMSGYTSNAVVDTFTANCNGATPPTCNVPTGLASANITYNAADVNWSAGGSETTWNLQYRTGTANWTTVPVNAPTYHISGLTPQTTYEIRVQANCGDNNTSDWTAAISFTTPTAPADPCDAPSNLQVTNITQTTATMTWTAGGTENSWKVGYKLNTASQWQEATVATTSYNLEGLTANSPYEVRVKAICAADNESDFITTTFTTAGVGIDNVTLTSSINLMPNPADNYIELSINSNVEVKEALVFNAFGQMIQTVQLNNNHARIDLSNVASGMYFVRVNSKGVSATKKFIRK